MLNNKYIQYVFELVKMLENTHDQEQVKQSQRNCFHIVCTSVKTTSSLLSLILNIFSGPRILRALKN